MVRQLFRRFWMPATICAIGVTLMSVGLPESQWLTVGTARLLTIGGVLFFGASVILFLRELKKTPNHEDRTREAKKISSLYSIVPTLEEMDTLFTDILEKELRHKLNLTDYLKLNARINKEILNITPDEATTPQEAIKAMSKVESKITKKYGQSTPKALLSIMTEVSGVLDSSGFGLKRFREQGKYKRLMHKLTKLRNSVTDEDINALVKEHIIASETLANILLFARRGSGVKAKHENTTYNATDFMSLPIVSGVSLAETGIREYMIGIRVKIGNRINMLETN